ncbi:unnamed protein product [Brachionus calyciflorus]|uniref:protein-histidine N-methyltransferase n=1 Tax=Brachionus calyciflorus TaxID=104777 RepID=A0A813NI32_9BILA|nr:unnamed protein product [Brachionus calyciflorus]
MFKFNFIEETDQTTTTNTNQSKKLKNDSNSNELVYDQIGGIYSYEELIQKRPEKTIVYKSLNLSNLSKIELIDSSKVILDESDELSKINETHDVVPGKYEGGLKVWELSIDLAKFVYNSIHFEEEKLKKLNFELDILTELASIRNFFFHYVNTTQNLELRVLELGCGHALPCLAILKMLEENLKNENLSIVFYLQDFNEQIVKDVTLENFKNYLEKSPLKNRVKINFVYGDWRYLHDKKVLPENYFNLILTSETIYNSANYEHLLNLFQLCLRSKHDDDNNDLQENSSVSSQLSSMVLLSSKTYYFGCGGNILEFVSEAKSSAYSFEASRNLLYDDLINCDKLNCQQVGEVKENKKEEEHSTNSQINIISKEIIKISKKKY